jgi:pyruvate carboxylase subunit B
MKKIVKFMDTSFRDGFQSCFGARVLTDDFLPALQASVDAGIQHFEAGGGARFQSLFFYCNESAFDMMDRFREVAGSNADLQTLARGINVVALSQQPRDIIDLHAKMFKRHGITTIRNFDALNDVNNLRYSGERIDHHGLHHQIVIAVMDLPPGCEGAHTTEFYLDRLQQILASDIPFQSICFKDASGTANPQKIYETTKGARKMVPQGTVLWFHTHDTAGVGISQNMAALEGGVDGIDLCKSPVSGGTCQPDILSMWQALKGTDFDLDIDIEKILQAEEVFEEAMQDYYVPPEAKMVSPIIPFSPMPGGALTSNTMMMRDTGTLHLFPRVIKEMSEVVRRGGFATSVTPVSQFYFQQAYANTTLGKWKKITEGYGNMVLGYFGSTPVEPDPEIVELAAEQLGKPVFKEDPLDVLEPGIPKAKTILRENRLPLTDENLFIIASCESKGLDFLMGKAKLNIRKKSDESPPPTALEKKPEPSSPSEGPRNYMISVDGRVYQVSISSGDGTLLANPAPVSSDVAPVAQGETIAAPTPGNILKILVNSGDKVTAEQPLLVMEAMKMETEIKAPQSGKILAIHVNAGDSLPAGAPLLTIA